MFRNAVFITTLLASSAAMTGCSSIWTKVGDMSYGMASFTKNVFLRGHSTKSDVSFAQVAPSEGGVYKTEIGEYVPALISQEDASHKDVSYAEISYKVGGELYKIEVAPPVILTASVDVKTISCLENEYLTADKNCASLEADTRDFAVVQTPISPEELPQDFAHTPLVKCPKGFKRDAYNSCVYVGL